MFRFVVSATLSLIRQISYPLCVLTVALTVVSVVSWPVTADHGITATVMCAGYAVYLAAVHNVAKRLNNHITKPVTVELREVVL